jgi:hypothetical protein
MRGPAQLVIMAFLPAFVPARASAAEFSLVLGIWFIAETGLWLAVVAWLADRGVRWLRRPAVQRWIERGHRHRAHRLASGSPPNPAASPDWPYRHVSLIVRAPLGRCLA